MKKIFFTLLVLCLFSVNAQETTKTPKHEIKINALYAIMGMPEFGYEYLLNDESTIGIDVLFSTEDWDMNFALTPHYRFFFGEKIASGFFTEIFGMLNSTETERYSYMGSDDYYTSNTETDFALGFAVGAKFVTKKSWTFEIFGGIGRNLLNSDSQDFVPRGGISIGKRF